MSSFLKVGRLFVIQSVNLCRNHVANFFEVCIYTAASKKTLILMSLLVNKQVFSKLAHFRNYAQINNRLANSQATGHKSRLPGQMTLLCELDSAREP